jgi:hypothetical protein
LSIIVFESIEQSRLSHILFDPQNGLARSVQNLAVVRAVYAEEEATRVFKKSQPTKISVKSARPAPFSG